jgi:NitT/TauT family transport system substrate-binding protein
MQGLEKGGAHKPMAFCEVAGRDPFFLLGREPNPGFSLRDLVGPRVAVVMEVPTPWICLQHDLRLAGIDPAQISLMPARSMADNAAALRAGEVDVIQLFHPYAMEVTQSGAGHVWYAAASRGPCSYTTLNTTREFAQREPDTLTAMCRAMYKTQQWIATHDGRALAERVASFFPDVPAATLAACYDDYRRREVWNRVPTLSRAGFESMRDAALGCGRLQHKFDYDEVADMRFAERALLEVRGTS